MKIELQEDTTLTQWVVFQHLHYIIKDPKATQAWYVKTFGFRHHPAVYACVRERPRSEPEPGSSAQFAGNGWDQGTGHGSYRI